MDERMRGLHGFSDYCSSFFKIMFIAYVSEQFKVIFGSAQFTYFHHHHHHHHHHSFRLSSCSFLA